MQTLSLVLVTSFETTLSRLDQKARIPCQSFLDKNKTMINNVYANIKMNNDITFPRDILLIKKQTNLITKITLSPLTCHRLGIQAV